MSKLGISVRCMLRQAQDTVLGEFGIEASQIAPMLIQIGDLNLCFEQTRECRSRDGDISQDHHLLDLEERHGYFAFAPALAPIIVVFRDVNNQAVAFTPYPGLLLSQVHYGHGQLPPFLHVDLVLHGEDILALVNNRGTCASW